ncbi:MAG: hypothetical protein LBF61_06310 [Azoarcus sp.]|jgi:hypothetical protein|nr:hypothetical protein [Azoarcus sp.]
MPEKEAPGGLSWSEFKAMSAEAGGWLWGTVQGAFNEKASVSQIVVDAVIGMIPLVGDVTAARDLIAVSLGMADDPKKRESKLEWVGLIVLIFALIPVIGGVIKGVGRLVIRAMKMAEKLTGAARMAHLCEAAKEIIAFLNRIGWKNAEAWFMSLKIVQYEVELVAKFKGLMEIIIEALGAVLKRASWVIPRALEKRMEELINAFGVLKDKGAEMIPQAVKELDDWLREMQQALYNGGDTLAHAGASAAGATHAAGGTTAHMAADTADSGSGAAKGAGTGGSAPKKGPPRKTHTATPGTENVSLVDEARLNEKSSILPKRTARGGLPKNPALVDFPVSFGKIYKPKPGYPDLCTMGIREDGKRIKHYTAIEAFSGRIVNRALRPGDSVIFRVFGPKRDTYGIAVRESYPGGRPGSAIWVGTGRVPQTAEEWRAMCAVLDEWNGDMFKFEARVPTEGTKVPIKGCFGKVSEQVSSKIPGQYLPGVVDQAVVRLPDSTYARISEEYEDFMKAAQDYIEAMKKANEEFLRTDIVPKVTVPPPKPAKWTDPETGLECEINATGWVDANGHWGYDPKPDRATNVTTEPLADTAEIVSKENAEVIIK